MACLFITQLSLLALVIASATVQAQPVEQQPDQVGEGGVELIPLLAQGRSVYDKYLLGQKVDGAQIIYSNRYAQSFDSVQPKITLNFNYPSASDNVENSYTITQVALFLEASDGAKTQAHVTKNGVGQKSISLEMVAQNSKSLRYMIAIYGKKL